jgi:hypothetical protein
MSTLLPEDLMVRWLFLAVASGALIASPATADDFCDGVAHVAAQVPSHFSALAGAETVIGRISVNYKLPGAQDVHFEDGGEMDACAVDRALDLNTGKESQHLYYSCAYLQSGGGLLYDRDAANVTKDALAARLASCLSVPMTAFTTQSGSHAYGINRNGVWYEIWSTGAEPAVELRIEAYEPPFSTMPNG